jgi:hypothetical protein
LLSAMDSGKPLLTITIHANTDNRHNHCMSGL